MKKATVGFSLECFQGDPRMARLRMTERDQRDQLDQLATADLDQLRMVLEHSLQRLIELEARL